MFINRALSDQLIVLSQQFPVITVLGPRQAGKTELTRKIFPQHQYVNLEDPELRLLASSDPKGFFNRFPGRLVIDEIQRVPALLSSVQVIVDQRREKGQFIVTGSHQTELAGAVSQSLAGRTAILHLLPLSIAEIAATAPLPHYDELIVRGFMPQLHSEPQMRTDVYYRSYLQTYVERDVRQLINIKDQIKFETFLRLCAGRVGSLFSASSLASDLGVDTKTVQHWLSILEASFIVRRLPPYFENIGKRLVKSPKLFFVEVGLAAYLLGIHDAQQLKAHPLRGALFENMVIMDLIKQRENSARDSDLYFYRDQNGVEVDALFRGGKHLIPIEVKSAETFHPSFADGLRKFRGYAANVGRGVVVYGGELDFDGEDYRVLSYRSCGEVLH